MATQTFPQVAKAFKPSPTTPKVKNPPLLGIINVVTIVYMAYYLWWRATASLNPQAPFFSWVLLIAEAFGVLNFLLFAWMTRNVSPTRLNFPPPPGLSVDVFIPSYNEDLEVLEATITGAVGIRYPHITYVLDDGRRPEVEALARRLGAEYLVRPDNTDHKAGNINHALKHTKGEFIAMLDADMVPQPDYLDRTLGYFDDEKLAFVQLPQEFYNRDSIQHDPRRRHWHEQSLFFRVIQPGKNHTNSAFWTGSPSVTRRKALEDIGGVATETVTEDIHTSVRLHAKGWKTYFLNEVLAYGIAPQTIYAFLLQRLRWAQGTMQLYRSKDSPFWKPGLTFRQRISYMASFLAYAESIQKIMLICTPTIIILFEVFPMNVNGISFVLHWLPYFILSILANRLAGRTYFNWFQTEKYNLLKTITFLQSFLWLIWPKPLKFKVTPKSVDDDVRSKERVALRGYMVLFGAIIGVSFAGIIRLTNGLSSAVQPAHYGVAIVWAVFNAGIILLGIRDVLSQKHQRKYYRFPYKNPATLFSATEKSLISVMIENISQHGVGFKVSDKFDLPSDQLSIYFQTPTDEYLVMALGKPKVHKRWWGHRWVGASFEAPSEGDRHRLTELLFVSLPGLLPDRGYVPVIEKRSERMAVPIEKLFHLTDDPYPLSIPARKPRQALLKATEKDDPITFS